MARESHSTGEARRTVESEPIVSKFDGSGLEGIEKAQALVKHIGRTFVQLRRDGRSQAWASLEEELMLNADLLISHGMISAKEWISMAIEIEGFRKSEAGTQQLPGDYLAKWLEGESVGNG